MSILRKLLDFQMSLTEKGRPLHRVRPLVSAGDVFFYQAPINTKQGPHIRDAVDVKRWMVLVIIALIPTVIMAIWNTGLQKMVYASGDYRLMDQYLTSSATWQGYFHFAFSDDRWITILKLGLGAFLPILLISYIVGILWEGLFAVIRGHEIAEGFLVTGLLYPLTLPSTIPYWMVAVGVSAGVVIGKELFGGSGMNILNPALVCRCFLFFNFPGNMTGEIWAGTHAPATAHSIAKMNSDHPSAIVDGYTQATPCGMFNVTTEIKRIHVDAIATSHLGPDVTTYSAIEKHFAQWSQHASEPTTLSTMTGDQMKAFVTATTANGGLGLNPDQYAEAYRFAELQYGLGHNTDAALFWGDRLGSMGETSIFACILGGLFLLYVGIASWRIMVGVILSGFITAWLFQFGAEHLGSEMGAWNPAKYALPAYKHLLMGGLAFGLVFMATEPVTAPYAHRAKWYYAALIGFLVIIIRIINPAYPEGVMLAILFGNVCAPLVDNSAIRKIRRAFRVRTS